MHLSADAVVAAYSFLRATRPFNRWRLPDADEIVFTVTGSKVHYGAANWSKRSLWVSGRLIGHTDTLLRVLAHEMAHFRADAQGETAVHGRLWHRAVRSICREHGWDAKAL